MIKFYDTCALLSDYQRIFKENEHFYISSVTLEELEDIKSSSHKDEDIKYKARRLVRFLINNLDNFVVIRYSDSVEVLYKNILPNNNDSKIILSALYLGTRVNEPIEFFTEDLCCYLLANSVKSDKFIPHLLNEPYISDSYNGITILEPKEENISLFYNTYSSKGENPFNLSLNEYIIIPSEDLNSSTEIYKFNGECCEYVPYVSLQSRMFGEIKPKDFYQRCLIDSLRKNQLTVVRGAAGTGKSLLSLAYLFEQLERHRIDKIIIFCNTVAVNGAARLGFYPGEKNDKLLDSQIGNLLSSKLGSKIEVERLIDENKLVLVPLADIRGYDTTGMNAGIYISEAQNLDIELMRLALQRIGEDSICIIDGDDEAQVDLPLYAGSNNGIKRMLEVFKGKSFFGTVQLQNIYRSGIARIAQEM